MLTKEETERFEIVMQEADRCESRATEAAVLLDAFDKLPPDRCEEHLAHLLQHFWAFPEQTLSNKEERIGKKRFVSLMRQLMPALHAILLPIAKARPPVEKVAHTLWIVLTSHKRPKRDAALVLILNSPLVPYARMPEPKEFVLAPDEYDSTAAAHKPAHATAAFIAEAVFDTDRSNKFSDFAGPLLALLKDRPPKEQVALLTTFLYNFQHGLPHSARIDVPEPRKPPQTPPGKPN